MRTLYIDCISGISGDMFIGALLDAGAEVHVLEEGLKKLKLEDEYELSYKKVNKNGITATKFDVILKHEHSHAHAHTLEHSHAHVHNRHEHSHDHAHTHEHSHAHAHTHEHSHAHEHNTHEHSHAHEHTHEHSHDHAHTHEHSHAHEHTHEHSHAHAHTHEHSHDREHTHEHHHHRSYRDIIAMIENAGFSKAVRDISLRLFKIIGEAEAKIHGVSLADVHFHEVGAVDSIIDIVGAALLIDALQIEAIHASAVPVGSGKIRIDHGIYPVPAPATLEILKGVKIEKSSIRSELTTPTGAALVAVLASEYGALPSMTVTAIGYGAGTKNFAEHPNVVRVIIGEQ